MDCERYMLLFHREMRIQNYCRSTIKSYSWHLRQFLEAHRIFNHPKSVTEDDIKAYLETVGQQSLAKLKQSIGAVKLFYEAIMHQPLKFRYIKSPRREQRLPDIIPPEKVRAMLASIRHPKHKAIVALLYGCGLRLSEVCNLRISDVDSTRMVLHIRGKGNKDRFAILTPTLLALLRENYRLFHPKTYLFEGANGSQYSRRSIQAVCQNHGGIHPHQLRHSYATALLDQGTDIAKVQVLLGHSNIKTTLRYTHISTAMLQKVPSPLNAVMG